jgi:hypothetical protein
MIRQGYVFFLILILAFSVGLGSVAHAMEGPGGVDITLAAAADHADGGEQEASDGADKGYFHHHSGCHGHHIGVAVALDEIAPVGALGVNPSPWGDRLRPLSSIGPTLRPPRA